jgi:Sperm-tail PG-rich repeat
MTAALGFLARTERDNWRAGGIVEVPQVNENLGPASYNVTADAGAVQRHQGYAPFLSTAARNLGAEKHGAADSPAPGSYELPVSHGARSSIEVFRSKSKRFQEITETEAALTPGPGTYLNQGSSFGNSGRGTRFSSGRSSTDSQGPAVKWTRVPSAPSIPIRDQTNGYEEGRNGELIMQRPVVPVRTGCGSDTPGCCDYSPSLAATKPHTKGAVKFGKGTDRLVLLEKAHRAAAAIPGPGHYNSQPGMAEDESALLYKPQRRSAAFQSTTKRHAAARTEPGPSPCTYAVSTPLVPPVKAGAKDQSFLSTAARFPEERANARQPGPSSYYCAAMSSFRSVKAATAVSSKGSYGNSSSRSVNRARRATTAPVGFQSTSLRFMARDTSACSLGPAAYTIPGMTDVAAQQTARRQSTAVRGAGGAFGSSAKRFQATADETQQAPLQALLSSDSSVQGTGAHGSSNSSSSAADAARTQQNKRLTSRTLPGGARPVHGPLQPRNSSAFASGVHRFEQCKQQRRRQRQHNGLVADVADDVLESDSPCPGTYYVEEKWDSSRGVIAMERSCSKRFQQQHRDGEHLGPGSYDAHSAQGFSGGRKGLMASGQQRFSGAGSALCTSDTPGPGHYNSDLLYGNLCKPTHNIAIAELSASIM